MHTHSCIYVQINIALQIYIHCFKVIALQEAATGTQQSSIQHHTIDNSIDTQQSSVHQPIPQYAIPNKGTASNKDQEASIYAMIHHTFSMYNFALKLCTIKLMMSMH